MIAKDDGANREEKHEQIACVDSRPTAHMSKDCSIMIKVNTPSYIRKQTTGAGVVTTSRQEAIKVTLNNGGETVQSNRVLHVPEISYSLQSLSSLCDTDHTVLFTNEMCLVK